ncbi:MAG TPA: DUF547 domain-containing protein, partial [Myxococcota bacterium]|nr:DUF547 domain-containing protein [Myxococcota bacterium]
LLAERRAALDAYVGWLARARTRLDRDNAQHAFWLNAYNALVLYGALEAGVPDSLFDVPGWLPWDGSGFFYERAWVVQGEALSLFEIHQERLLGRVMDLRDHGALACGARSCPPLRSELYRNADVEEQLRDQMRAWLSDPVRGLRVDDDRVWLSPLFDWYARDLDLLSAGDDPCTLAARFLDGDAADRLRALADQGCPRAWLPFDRALDAVAP